MKYTFVGAHGIAYAALCMWGIWNHQPIAIVVGVLAAAWSLAALIDIG